MSVLRIDLHQVLTILLLNRTYPVLANSVDPDQLDSEEAKWSGSALFVIKYVNFYQNPRSSNLIGGRGILIHSARHGLNNINMGTQKRYIHGTQLSQSTK